VICPDEFVILAKYNKNDRQPKFAMYADWTRITNATFNFVNFVVTCDVRVSS
jgi:hypothetical protein